jgi:hypothetical protein
MANNKRDFTDRKIKCKKCFADLGEQRLNSQILIIGKVAIFNMVAMACLRCESINNWQSPNLMRGENEPLDRRYPDRLEDLPKPEKHLVKQLGIKKYSKKLAEKFDNQDSKSEQQNHFSAS